MPNSNLLLEFNLADSYYEKVLQYLFNESTKINIAEFYTQELSLSNISIGLVQPLKISALKRHVKIMNKGYMLFPTVFYPSTINFQLKPNVFNKMKLNFVDISFSVASNKKMVFNTYSFSPIIFHLQILQHLISNNTSIFNSKIRFSSINMLYKYFNQSIEIDKHSNESPTSISIWLNDQIGEGYSFGELIDFIDRLYDQHKSTQISAQCFQFIFRCFGQHTIEIGNSAFDYFIEFRDFQAAWGKSIRNFLCDDLFLAKSFAFEMTQILLSNPY